MLYSLQPSPSFASINSAEHFGIQVHGGARLETEETNFIRKVGGANTYCYRTEDSVKKVTAFYQKHPGLTSLGVDETGGMFIKKENEHTVYIKIQSPWQPAKGGQMNKDTIIYSYYKRMIQTKTGAEYEMLENCGNRFSIDFCGLYHSKSRR